MSVKVDWPGLRWYGLPQYEYLALQVSVYNKDLKFQATCSS